MESMKLKTENQKKKIFNKTKSSFFQMVNKIETSEKTNFEEER